MPTTVSGAFINAFVTTCLRRGLTKEAAAALLHDELTQRAMLSSPGFMEGFCKVAGAHSTPASIAGPDFFDKRANFGRIMSNVGKAMWGNRTAVGTGLGAGAGAWALAKYTGRGTGSPALAPTAGYSGWDAAGSRNIYDEQLHQNSQGVAEMNRGNNSRADRLQELRAAVSGNAVGSGNALREMQRLQAEGNPAQSYLSQLNSFRGNNDAEISQLTSRQQGVENRRRAWWYQPVRWWDSLRGVNTDQRLNAEAAGLQDTAATLHTNRTMADTLARRVMNGYTGGEARPLADGQAQQRFFPTN